MIYVFTSNVNWFDNLRPPATGTDHNVRYICFTNLPADVLPTVLPWEYRHIEIEGGSGARTSRMPKILAHKFLPKDAEYSIYHDCNYQLRVSPNEIIDLVAYEQQWASYRHPARSCVYDEARIVMEHCPLIPRDEVQRQIERYRAEGFPEKAGLWANGFLVRRHTPEVAALNEAWWNVFKDGCARDQLAFPVARHAMKANTRTLEGNVFASQYTIHRWHAAWKDKDDNPNFWKQRDELRRELKARSIYGFPDY